VLIGASLVNASQIASLAMPEFKQLSRSVKGLPVLVTGAASGMGRATARLRLRGRKSGRHRFRR
jgi:hypothetical protein